MGACTCFKADEFTPTKWDTADEKAAFANWLVAFINIGFPESRFPKTKYRQLSNCFGHIAHFDRDGFYHAQFATAQACLGFLQQLTGWGCFGDPASTFCDVERAIQKWMEVNDIVARQAAVVAEQQEISERATLARLKAKYES